ncbi:hypothetical protein JOD45_002173 [Scopulibacillus daqui]|uniref:GmrSD restriction endonucleases N-terminal domain-containing protein n=1 Tax=Scopulibacillus daqui TaxID=1469162 RepID=A0ABS2Q0Y2_9BACL|nr:DUF262 domain-containing protein [Scopulibacillus daqui]MBM7645948.1 hypothetical protein [Scopulibacillus daqui]
METCQKELLDPLEGIDFEKWRCQTQSDILTAHNLVQRIKDGYNKVHSGIVLDPEYQREYKFSVKKESSIIESLLLDIPIPVIYLSKNTSKDIVLFNVIDGMHRLNSIYRFMNNEYALKALKILTPLEGRRFMDLPPKLRNKLEFSSQIRLDSIDIDTNPELEYEVFLRFNQETNPLTKQELNEVLFRSDFSFWFKEYVQDLIKNESWYQLLNVNEKRIRDKYINYILYVMLAYNEIGLIKGKNDTPRYVASFMKTMQQLPQESLEKKKEDVKQFLHGFLSFCDQLSKKSGVTYIFSRQLIDRKPPRGVNKFLISYVIPIVMSYRWLKKMGLLDGQKQDFLKIYEAIREGMDKAHFYNVGRESTTSYTVQKMCCDKIKVELEGALLR